MAVRQPFPLQRQAGFYYAEVLLSVVLLTILLVPALQALTAGVSNNAGSQTARQLNLQSKMEEVLALPFGQLYAETYPPIGNNAGSLNPTFSDAVGMPDRRVVVLYRYDAITKALSANDTGLLYVSVYYLNDGSATGLRTLAGRWW